MGRVGYGEGLSWHNESVGGICVIGNEGLDLVTAIREMAEPSYDTFWNIYGRSRCQSEHMGICRHSPVSNEIPDECRCFHVIHSDLRGRLRYLSSRACASRCFPRGKVRAHRKGRMAYKNWDQRGGGVLAPTPPASGGESLCGTRVRQIPYREVQLW